MVNASRIRQPLILVALIVAAACKTTTPANPPTPTPPATLDLAAVSTEIAADVARQLGRLGQERTMVVDPLIDPAGQQTLATRRVEQEVFAAMPTAVRGLSVVPFGPESAGQANIIATGTLEREAEPGFYKLNLSLTDRVSGLVIAHTVSRFRQADLDITPTTYFAEAPSNAIDRPTTGYITTSRTEKGSRADGVYLDSLPTTSLINSAIKTEEAGQWADALEIYARAAARPDGKLARTFQGVYLCNLHLGRSGPAEAAFGQLVTLGFATNSLSMKFLFQPAQTSFVQGDSASVVYPMWLRQIARGAQESKACFKIVGHSSKTGTAEYNYDLSSRRAARVQSLLPRDLQAARSCTEGRGFDEVIIGTGTDDAKDAPDRRVVFEIVPCEELKCVKR